MNLSAYVKCFGKMIYISIRGLPVHWYHLIKVILKIIAMGDPSISNLFALYNLKMLNVAYSSFSLARAVLKHAICTL